jgi:two-component system catabolic regulation response regulator CreB/two-component system response regulator ChvI
MNRILLVDNEADIALGFKIGLEDNGFIVDAFNDPELALSNFKAGSYDLLLLDIRMPKMDGFESYLKMKKMDSKVKVFFITASEMYYHEELTKEALTRIGAKHVIRKPITIDDLIKEITTELD